MNTKILWAVVLVVGVIIVGYLAFGGDNGESTLQDEFIAEESVAVTIEEGVYKVDTEKTVVNWEGSKTVVKDYIDRGTIGVAEGQIVVGDTVSGEIVFDINTINATETGSGGGQSALASHLRSADFFDAEKFPTATFVIKSMTKAEGGSVQQLVGDLTVKGITHEVVVPVTLSQDGNVIMMKSLLVLDRTMWDIRYGSDKFFDNLKDNVIDDNFTVSFELVAVKG